MQIFFLLYIRFGYQYPTIFADPVGLLYPPLAAPVPFDGKCLLGAPVPLGNGWTEPEALGRGKGAAPDCVEKGPLGGGREAPDPEPPVGALPDPPAVTVTMTERVEVTVWTAGQPLDGLPGAPADPDPDPEPEPEPEPLPDPTLPVGADPPMTGPVVDGQMTSYVVLVSVTLVVE